MAICEAWSANCLPLTTNSSPTPPLVEIYKFFIIIYSHFFLLLSNLRISITIFPEYLDCCQPPDKKNKLNEQKTRKNNRTDELVERIHQLECKEAIILKESHELREQNELLEFRIIELEEDSDKVSFIFHYLFFPFDGSIILLLCHRLAQ